MIGRRRLFTYILSSIAVMFLLGGCYPELDKEEVFNSWAADYSAKELLGFAGVETENVEKITLIKHRGMQYQWETSDIEIIADILSSFDSIQISRNDALGGVGAYLGVTFTLKEPVNKRKEIGLTIYNDHIYSPQFPSDNHHYVFEVTGGKTAEEWDAMLELCEEVEPSLSGEVNYSDMKADKISITYSAELSEADEVIITNTEAINEITHILESMICEPTTRPMMFPRFYIQLFCAEEQISYWYIDENDIIAGGSIGLGNHMLTNGSVFNKIQQYYEDCK